MAILAILCLGTLLLNHVFPSSASPVNLESLFGGKVISHKKVGIMKVNLAIRSFRFPDIIPLLFGNQILSVEKHGSFLEIHHNSEKRTELFPIKRKRPKKHIAAFVFKQSSLGVYPVPMENTVLISRLVLVSAHFADLHMWLVSQGVYSRVQRYKQRLHATSLLRDFADNAQRSLGVKSCGKRPTVSGLCNNRENTISGVTIQPFRQDVKEKRKPTSAILKWSPSPRFLSNSLFLAKEQIHAPQNTNALMIFFGQFIDHELAATPPEEIDEERQAPIPHPGSDKMMSFTRSGILRFDYAKCCKEYSTDRMWKRGPFNTLTSFIDGGAIYGSDNLRAIALRSFKHGELLLKQREGELNLPVNNNKDLVFHLENESDGREKTLFAAGDGRANENPFLLSIHTLFAREHNRVCRLIRKWTSTRRSRKVTKDEWIYHQARLIVIAELQSITFNEFVPAMLGKDALGTHDGYDPSVDARLSTSHAAFAYRWGHSGVPETFDIKTRKGKTVRWSLKDIFFGTKLFDSHGLDNIILAAMNTPASNIDLKISDSLRDFLFNPNEQGILDLVALNIQRSRDLGIPSYKALQKIFKTGKGLENIHSDLGRKLLDVYGDEENIDAFVGSLAETAQEGSLLGPLLHAINADQFKRLRDGDRFYYENINWHPYVVDMPLVQKIREHKIRFGDVIRANTKVKPSDIGDRETAFTTNLG